MNKGEILENTYEILEEIGAGGGGVVYRARHLRLNIDVVVKRIKDNVVDKVNTHAEEEILKRLKHSYLPRIYDFIENETGIYTVMDFISGKNLDKALKEHGPYTQKEVKKWAEQLGEALNYLHSQTPPIIHSDIKPANIMLMETGDICLIDFNIALAMGGDVSKAVGISARYSPPEQYSSAALYKRITYNYSIRNSNNSSNDKTQTESDVRTKAQDTFATETMTETKDEETELLQTEITTKQKAIKKADSNYDAYIGKGIDTSSDIYSLGMTLYYLLTGTEPEPDFDKIVPVEKLQLNISEGFAYIIDKMIMIAPKDRYQNGGEFLKAVKNCYKLDHKYIALRRKQKLMQAVASAGIILGAALVGTGIAMIKRETDSNYYQLLEQAEMSIQQEQYSEAQECILAAQNRVSYHIEAYKKEIYLEYIKEKYDTCVSLGQSIIDTQPFSVKTRSDMTEYGDILYIMGNAYYELADYANAKSFFERAIEYNAENALYYRDYAIVLARLGQTDNAQKALDNTIAQGAAQDSVYMAQGEIFHMKGQNDEAVSCFAQTLASTADREIQRRAVFLCDDSYKNIDGDAIDEEIAFLEKYNVLLDDFMLKENLADAYVRKAQSDSRYETEYYAKALELFQKIYDSGYVTYQLQENMAVVYEYMDAFDEAQKLLLEMAERYPKRYEVYKRLAYFEADRQQTKENADRDYRQMRAYYEQAVLLYDDTAQDMEMSMLAQMLQELEDGGWFMEFE